MELHKHTLKVHPSPPDAQQFCSMMSQFLFCFRAFATFLAEGRTLRDRIIAIIHAGASTVADLTRPSTAVAGPITGNEFILQADEVDFVLNAFFFVASAALFTSGWICATRFSGVARGHRHGKATRSDVNRDTRPEVMADHSPRACTPPSRVPAVPGRALRRALTDPPSPLPRHVQQPCFPVKVLGDRDAPSASGV